VSIKTRCEVNTFTSLKDTEVFYNLKKHLFMRRIHLLLTVLFVTGAIVITACSDNNSTTGTETTSANGNEVHGDLIKPEDVQLTTPLNQEWIAQGKSIYDVKCQSCHRLTDERIVGPGWEGLTKKREPHWLMNMITNVDIMLEQDAEAQKLLEQCLVRMPNQNISKEESRAILEFMRHNDGVQ
jgi:mono/diheme cytochrome c family protein